MGTLGDLRRSPSAPPALAVALLATSVLFAGPPADAVAAAPGKRYVAPGGSDAGPGTARRPWATIQKALDTLAPGQTAYLSRGTYPAPSNFERSGRRGSPIRIRNRPGAHPLVTGRLRIRGSYLMVRGLHFRGQTSANPDDYLIYLYGGDHVTIAGSELEHGYKSAIYVGEPDDLAHDLRLIGNHIHHNGKSPERRWRAHGLYCGHCRGGVVANNVFDHNLAWNLQLYPDTRGLLVTENTIVHAGASGVMVGGDADRASQDVRIVNNIIASNAGWGVQMYSEDGGPRPQRTVARRNLLFGNGEGAVRAAIGGLTATRSIHRAPRFRGRHDYRLRAGSPALDRALRRWTLPFDHDGRRRPRGAGFDLGAFEH
jgi:hypothetical protein